MQLKDAKGNTVVLFRGDGDKDSFFAIEGLDLVEVDEAIVSAGKEIFLPKELVKDRLTKEGFGDVRFKMTDNGGIDIDTKSECNGYSPPRSYTYFIDGERVSEKEFDRLLSVRGQLISHYGLHAHVYLGTNTNLPMESVLEMLGEGAVVTPESIMRGCKKGESKPRLCVGDYVVIKGKEASGVVKSMSSKVTVLVGDTKCSAVYSKVFRSDAPCEDAVVDGSIRAGFNKVLGQTKRIYRAKLERMNVSLPMFPEPEQRVIQKENEPSCACPICGWRMADFSDNTNRWDREDDGFFTCGYCKLKGFIIQKTEEEVTLLMMRMPAKNRFAIKEAQCCSNCNLFEFEVGRQGKRSTGYCKYANQCVQAFTTCELWMPREPRRYDSNLKQHVTNLGYGVTDARNTGRNDIRETIYREPDHAAEMKRAEDCKARYTQAYARFMEDLRKMADGVPAVDLTDEEKERWKKDLDDPC